MLSQALPDPGYVLILLLGLFLGLQHALDADHIAAISSLLTRTGSVRRSSRLGVFWGLGHTFTLLAAGTLIVVTKTAIPVTITLSFELLVGIMLIVLGTSVIVTTRRERIHIHFHKHKDRRHVHLHSHRWVSGHSHDHRSLLVGMIHGLAGSGAVALLALSSSRSILEALMYIVVFGIGSTLGMVGLSVLIGIPFIFGTNRLERLDYLVRPITGILSMALGLGITLETLHIFSGFLL